MKNFETFKQEIETALKEHFPNTNIKMKPVAKNNETLTGVTVLKEGSNFSPCVYLDPFYERFTNGYSLEIIIEEICELFEENMDTLPCPENIIDLFRDWNWVKENVACFLVGRKYNTDLLSQVPWKSVVDDLAFIYKVKVNDEATITIRNEHLSNWNISAEQLHNAAFENTERLYPATAKSMMSVLSGLVSCEDFDVPEEKDLDGDPVGSMYVISNTCNTFGAVSIFTSNILAKLASKFKDDLYVLPSSVHEVIVIPYSMGNNDCMSEMVSNVNTECLHMDEVLSDHAYIYKKEEAVIIAA